MQWRLLGSYYLRNLLLRCWPYLLYYSKDYPSRLASLLGNLLKGLTLLAKFTNSLETSGRILG